MIITSDEITMRVPDNWHVHFRQDILLPFLVTIFLRFGWRGRAVGEPNTQPPKLTGADAISYGREIKAAAAGLPGADTFTPVVTIQITESTTPAMIREAVALGVRVGKVYPRDVTTHSANGVRKYRNIYPALGEAEALGMITQFHAEHPSYGVPGGDKEAAFRPILDNIRGAFPQLRISVEHVSSRHMVKWVLDQPEHVGASVTIQHIELTADDLRGYSRRSGGGICVNDAGCKPCIKDPRDRDAIRKVILSGHSQFWYGGDDAAHLKSAKYARRCACGVWNTLAALPLLIQFFEANNALLKLEPFLCQFGAQYYGYPPNEGQVTFRRESWTVPTEVEVPGLNDSIIPFFDQATIHWKLVD